MKKTKQKRIVSARLEDKYYKKFVRLKKVTHATSGELARDMISNVIERHFEDLIRSYCR